MEFEEFVPILPTPRILPLLLSPYVTCPLFLGEMAALTLVTFGANVLVLGYVMFLWIAREESCLWGVIFFKYGFIF